MQQSRRIDVISLCDANGEVRPLRIRAVAEAGEVICGKICEIISEKEYKCLGAESWIYLCRVQTEERRIVVELKFSVPTHSWFLMRRLY